VFDSSDIETDPLTQAIQLGIASGRSMAVKLQQFERSNPFLCVLEPGCVVPPMMTIALPQPPTYRREKKGERRTFTFTRMGVQTENQSFGWIEIYGIQEQESAPWRLRVHYLEHPIAVFSSRSVAKLYAKYLIDRAIGITTDRENRQLVILPHLAISSRGSAHDYDLSLCKHLKLEEAISLPTEFGSPS